MEVNKELLKSFNNWYKSKGWTPFKFQHEVLEYYSNEYSGILNAPTGSGKTYALWIPAVLNSYLKNPGAKGLKVIWVTPVRALAKDIQSAMIQGCEDLNINWKIASRTGDTSATERAKLKKEPPDALITTPESLHIMLASKGYASLFSNLEVIVVDEWHELLGSKRGVQVELALSRLKGILSSLKIWGISATIGNIEEALHVLLGECIHTTPFHLVKADINKKIEVVSLMPDDIEKFPWGGHLGIKLLHKILPIIYNSKTTLIFTNTRSQCEIWYQKLLEADPDLAGLIGLHHGSLSYEVRSWVETALHAEALKVVVCTASLDLGVDFRPVESVIQIGGPKGIARFLQRAGRSGHQPGAVSKIYFVPAHSLELIEGAALRTAIAEGRMESRFPVVRAFDVLIQYLVTLAVSDGFKEKEIFNEIINTHAFNTITEVEWRQVIEFVTSGGTSLKNYEEFYKVVKEDDVYKVTDRRIAMRHRMSIGTIVSDAMMTVRFLKGGRIGTIEENFISRLKPGDVFSFGGRILELIMIKEMQAIVRISKTKKSIVPQWLGGKMPLSSQLSDMIRTKLTEAMEKRTKDEELKILEPLLEKQKKLSIIPKENQFLIETFLSKDGFHVFFYPFEGRYVNEGLSALFTHRFSRIKPITFSIAMSDYGIEMLTDTEIDIREAIDKGLFSTENLFADILGGLNAAEMARRKFRDIAHIAGLIFGGYPGKQKKNKDLQASSRLFFEVFSDYEPDNLLLKQAYDEVLFDQLDEVRLRAALERINRQEIVIKRLETPSPFSFPILVEMFRQKASTESIEERVMRMIRGANRD